MKKVKRIVLALVAALTLLGCKNQIGNVSTNLQKAESAVNEMKTVQNNAVQDLFHELTELNTNELYRSSFFKGLRTIQDLL